MADGGIDSTSNSSPVKKICEKVSVGSVRESRMKRKELNTDGGSSTTTTTTTTVSITSSPAADQTGALIGGKRRTWKSQVVHEGKVQLGSTRGSASPAQYEKVKKVRRKPPVPITRSRSDVIVAGSMKETTNSSQLRKSKSECVRIEDVKREIGWKPPVVDGKVVVNENEFFEEEEEEEEGAEALGEEETKSEEEEEEKKEVSEIKEIVVFEPERDENPVKEQEQVDEDIHRVPATTRTVPKTMPDQLSGINVKERNQTTIRRNIANPSPPRKHTPSDFHARRSEVYRNHDAKSAQPERRDSAEGHCKLQNLADLIMWRDVSKSTLVFGLGTFAILSSSYTKEANISFISVVSYIGLVYLALVFLYRSLLCRGRLEEDDREEVKYVLGEEEAMWLLRMLLPYLNEFLLKLKALFSGDPATTIKLEVLLFVLARCGSSITIWNLTRFGFFAVFLVPKLCSSYSSHITDYGVFWVRRFRDAWDSCTHKKAVTGAVFTLVWNLCSAVARIWAVFMLYVAFRYYQQHMMTGAGEDEVMTADRPSVVTVTSTGKKESSKRAQRL